MLKALRHKGTQKNIYILLAVLIVVSFVVTGIQLGADDHKLSGGALAVIGKHSITVQEYLDSYRAVQRQASFVFGDKLNEVKDRLNFKGEAWDRLLLLDYARRQHIRATDAEVVQWLASQKAFQSKGRFDEKLYSLYVERGMRSTPRAFEEEIRQMLTIGKVQDSFKGAGTIPDDKLKDIYQKETTERDLLFAVVKTEDKEAALKKMKELKDKVKNGDFETVLKAEGLVVTPVAKYHAGMYPEGTYPSQNLQLAAETLGEGTVSDAFEVPQGAALIKVTKVYPFDVEKFEKEKEAFRKGTEEKKFGEDMTAFLEKLRKDLSLNLERMKQIFPEDAKPEAPKPA